MLFALPPARPVMARPAATRVVFPLPGDWEGAGPHGLRMSFALSGRGRNGRVRFAALSLPNGCRSGPTGGFSTVNVSKLRYYPPAPYPQFLPGGAFTIKRPGQFAIVGVDVDIPKYPVVITGGFRSARIGSASVPVYAFKCPRGTGWGKQSHFHLDQAVREPVADGAYAGTLPANSTGATGTVKATVIGGGRVLSDFAVAYACNSGGGASFELGPSRAAGEFIGANGAVAEHWTPAGVWSGHFARDRTLAGTFTDAHTGDCTEGQSTPFSASLSSGG
jgi:hypothetical protein